MQAELESQRAKENFFDKAFKVSRREVAAVKGIVDGQKARLDAASARMAELKNRRMR